MTARVLPFPLARRRPYVRRQAAQVARCTSDGATAYLRNQLAVQRSALLAKGIASELVEEVLGDAERVIRAEAASAYRWGGAA